MVKNVKTNQISNFQAPESHAQKSVPKTSDLLSLLCGLSEAKNLSFLLHFSYQIVPSSY